MKAIITTIAAIFLLALFNEGVFSSAISSRSGVKSQSSISPSVNVQTINGVLHCDSLICPNNAASCQVTKRNDPNDFMTIIRHRKCIDANGKVIKEEKLTEPNLYGGPVNFNIHSSASGRKLTPEEQRELDKHLKETRERIQKERADMEESMRPFKDGSFQRDLKNQINQEIRKNMRFNPDY